MKLKYSEPYYSDGMWCAVLLDDGRRVHDVVHRLPSLPLLVEFLQDAVRGVAVELPDSLENGPLYSRSVDVLMHEVQHLDGRRVLHASRDAAGADAGWCLHRDVFVSLCWGANLEALANEIAMRQVRTMQEAKKLGLRSVTFTQPTPPVGGGAGYQSFVWTHSTPLAL